MALRCTVCDHPQRAAIDSLVSLGVSPLRNIAKQFDLGHTAIYRHKASGHISAKLTKAVAKAESREADEFLDAVRSAMAQGAQGAANGLARAGEIDAVTAYRAVPAFLAQQLKAAELLGQATGRLNNQVAPAGGNIYLSVILPRELGPVQPAIETIETTAVEVHQVSDSGVSTKG